MKSFLLAFLTFTVIHCFAQNDSIIRVELRALQQSEVAELNQYAETIYAVSDSAFLTGSKKWTQKMDSLCADSAMIADGVVFLCKLEKYLLIKNQRNVADRVLLNQVFDGAKSLGTQTAYYRKLHEFMSDNFVAMNDWESAMRCKELLHDAAFNDVLSKVETAEQQADSVTEALVMQKALLRTTENDHKQRQMLWMTVSGGIAVLLLVVIIAFLIGRKKLQRRLIEESRRASDRSELEVLTKKCNDLKAEIDLQKGAGRLSQEKLTAMEDSRRKLIQNLKQLADEINSGLDEVKAQGENNKAGMNPTAYMAVQNAVTRMGNTIAQRFQSLSDSLR
jgi:cell division protein FtsB